MKNTPEMSRYQRKQAPGLFPSNIHVNISYLTGFHSANCLPLETSSLKWHEDVTADSGITLARSIPNGLAVNVTVGENKSPQISRLNFPTWKDRHSGNYWHGLNHQTWDLSSDTVYWQRIDSSYLLFLPLLDWVCIDYAMNLIVHSLVFMEIWTNYCWPFVFP